MGRAAASTRAYKNTLEQAVFGEQMGWHAFWTVEHHFLEEFSHCSNPEVLYGAVAARTSRMRMGYGVRLMPKPYNHPVRSAESAAVLDLLSDGRVDFGTGRSSTRAELEGFGIDPGETREHVARGDRAHRRLLDAGRVRVRGQALVDAPAPRAAEAAAAPAPADLGRHGSPTTAIARWASSGSGCARSRSAAAGGSKRSIDMYRAGIRTAGSRSAHFVNDHAATFTMVNCAPTKRGVV